MKRNTGGRERLKTAVYFADTDCLRDAELLESARGIVSRTRRERTDRMRFAASKRLSLGAGLLLMRAMSDEGLDPFKSDTAEGKHGKPYLTAYPEMRFSLAHSGSIAMCVTADVNTGCDIERIADARPEVAERFFDESETRDISGTEDPLRAARFYWYWTLKESYVKCLGTGMSTELGSFRIRETDSGIRVADGDGTLPFSFLIPACPDGYAAACCFECASPPETAETECVDLFKFIAKFPAE